MIRLLIITLINIMYFQKIECQVIQEWITQYDTSQSNVSATNSACADSYGNFYITGSHKIGNSNKDIILIKYNSNGQILWSRAYNGSGNGNDFATSLKIYNDTEIYITGLSTGQASGYDYVTLKFDSSGMQKWVSRFAGLGNNYDASYAIATDAEGNCYVAGESYDPFTNHIDCVTIKYDSSGEEKWVRRFVGNNVIGYAITTDEIGNVFVAGRADGKYFTIRYNTFGDQEWVSFYNGTIGIDNSPNAIGLDGVGNVFVAGVSIGSGHYWDYATVKYNSMGVEQWVRRYNGTADYIDQLNALTIDKNGNVYVTGNGTETGRGYDYVTIKYSNDGIEQWISKYNNGLNDIATAIRVDQTGNVYVTGRSDGNGSHYDYATVKLDSTGNQSWIIRYNYSTSHDDEATAMDIDEIGNIYVTGLSYIRGQQHYDIITIKYSQSITGVYPVEEFPSSFSLSQNFPNPFNPKTTINYNCSGFNNVLLKVYDLLGNEVATLVNEKKPAGSYEVEFDGINFSSGIFFYKLEVDGKIVDTKRMVLLK